MNFQTEHRDGKPAHVMVTLLHVASAPDPSLTPRNPGVSARSSCSACDESCGLRLRSSTGQRRKTKKRLLIMPDPPRNCTQHGQSHRFSRLVAETSVVCDTNEALPGGESRWFCLKPFVSSFSRLVSLCRSCGAFFWYVGLRCIWVWEGGQGTV